MALEITRKWNAWWICGEKSDASEYFRTTFDVPAGAKDVTAYLCGLGFHELIINGVKADDRELAPVITQYDKHVGYIAYDISKLLNPGRNVIIVWLGNGLYEPDTDSSWNFINAPWRHLPKLICEVVADGKTILSSNESWKRHFSPITFNQLRNGECYDARLEIDGLEDPDFDDSAWPNCRRCNPPGGLLVQEDCEPCKVTEVFDLVKIAEFFNGNSPGAVYDVGENITGRCEIAVEGPAGSVVELIYSEHILTTGEICQDNIKPYVNKGFFQTERYTLKGEGIERWHSRFTWHGFRYCRVVFYGKTREIKVHSIQAQGICTAFKSVGKFAASDDTLNQLQKLTRRSYISNFTGIPTDCPHREKNGWTGDFQIAIETGLWNYDVRRASDYFIRTFRDTQRVNGQLPGIAPTGGWGYNWGSGPGWDIALFEVPWRIRLFTGDEQPVQDSLKAMELYVDYANSMAVDGIVDYGLGDWSCVCREKMTDVAFTSTCYYYYAVRILSYFKPEYEELADSIRTALNKKFYHGNGVYSDNDRTAVAGALYFGIAEESEKALVAKNLVEQIRGMEHTAGFGIFGAKYIPRVLADNGYLEDAYKVVTQRKFPGWGYWLEKGATTLWERWDGSDSQNHIMFGDISAWMFEYLAGIKPDVDAPGFKKFIIKPAFELAQLDYVDAEHDSVYGKIAVKYNRTAAGEIHGEYTIPAGTSATIYRPDGSVCSDCTGKVEF